MFRKFNKFHQQGFTLIELMVVIAILALLGGVVAPQVMNKLKEAKPQKAAIDIERIGMALDMYAVQNGDYPTTEQGLDALEKGPLSSSEHYPKGHGRYICGAGETCRSDLSPAFQQINSRECLSRFSVVGSIECIVAC